jgi:D-amino-acid dehydrogenase
MATAYALARRGVKVTIVEQEEEPARGASFANGAQLSYSYTDALGSPGLLRHLPQLLFAADPAFRFTPSMDPDFLRWGLAFLRNCSDARFHANTLEGLKLGLESRLALHELLALHPIDFAHAAPGKLHLLEGRDALHAARQLVKFKRRSGADQKMLSPSEAARLEPALAEAAPRLSGVIHSPREEVGDPYRFCLGLLDRLKADYGVTVRFGAAVRRLDLACGRAAIELDGERISAARTALCTGIGTARLLRGTGISAPIWPMKGYSITAPPGSAAPRLSITDTTRKLVFCSLGGTVRVAGLADLGARDSRIHPRRLASLVGAARASLPGAADYDNIGLSWSGLRPMTPSSLPIIRRERAGLVLNVGHGALGWTFAMGAAERAADLMLAAA